MYHRICVIPPSANGCSVRVHVFNIQTVRDTGHHDRGCCQSRSRYSQGADCRERPIGIGFWSRVVAHSPIIGQVRFCCISHSVNHEKWNGLPAPLDKILNFLLLGPFFGQHPLTMERDSLYFRMLTHPEFQHNSSFCCVHLNVGVPGGTGQEK